MLDFTLNLGRAQYACTKELGEGNFAKVFEAQNATTKETYAVKIFKNNNAEIRDLQFNNEVQIMKKLNHPNIIRIIDVSETSLINGQQNPQKVIVVEKAQKYTLFDYLKGGNTFTEDICRYYFRKLILGLNYCHLQGYAHKDIKPENILFDSDYELKITDFGMAEAVDKLSTNQNGTSNYFPPQVHLRMDYYPQEADLFASAILLFMMYQGNPPFTLAKSNDPYYKLLIQNKLTFWVAHGQKWSEGVRKF